MGVGAVERMGGVERGGSLRTTEDGLLAGTPTLDDDEDDSERGSSGRFMAAFPIK
jgi:hypothetical protein